MLHHSKFIECILRTCLYVLDLCRHFSVLFLMFDEVNRKYCIKTKKIVFEIWKREKNFLFDNLLPFFNLSYTFPILKFFKLFACGLIDWLKLINVSNLHWIEGETTQNHQLKSTYSILDNLLRRGQEIEFMSSLGSSNIHIPSFSVSWFNFTANKCKLKMINISSQ